MSNLGEILPWGNTPRKIQNFKIGVLEGVDVISAPPRIGSIDVAIRIRKTSASGRIREGDTVAFHFFMVIPSDKLGVLESLVGQRVKVFVAEPLNARVLQIHSHVSEIVQVGSPLAHLGSSAKHTPPSVKIK